MVSRFQTPNAYIGKPTPSSRFQTPNAYIGKPTPIPEKYKTPAAKEKAESLPKGKEITTTKPKKKSSGGSSGGSYYTPVNGGGGGSVSAPSLPGWSGGYNGPNVDAPTLPGWNGGSSASIGTPTPIPEKYKTPEVVEAAKSLPKAKEVIIKEVSKPSSRIAPSYSTEEKNIAPSSIKEWSIQPAPSRFERYKSSIKGKGYIKGTLGFVGSEVSSLAWRGQEIAVKKYGGKYDPQSAELIGSVAETSPYFTPAAPYILLASGAEQIGTTSGRKRITEQQQEFKEKGWSPALAQSVAWGIPIVETGLGFVGAKVGADRIRTLRNVKNADTTFLATENVLPPSGNIKVSKVSEVNVVSETRIGGKTYFGTSSQDVFKYGDELTLSASKGYVVPESKTVISGDKGFGLLIKRTPSASRELEIYPTTSVSLGNTVGKAKRFGAASKGETQLFDFAGEGTYTKTYGMSYNPSGNIPLKQETIGAFNKVGESNLFSFRGGTPNKFRLYKSGDTSFTTPGKLKGFFYRTNPSSISEKPIGNNFRVTRGSNIIESKAPSGLKFKKLTLNNNIKSSIVGQSTALEQTAKVAELSKTYKIPGTTFAISKVPLVNKSLTLSSIYLPGMENNNKKDTSLSPVSKIAQIQSTESKSRSGKVSKQSDASISATIPATAELLASASLQGQQTKYPTKTEKVNRSTQITNITGTITPKINKPIIPKPFWFGLPSLALPKQKPKSSGYIPQAKSKSGNWISLSRKPLTRSAALSRGARAVDQTLSAQFRIRKVKGKAQGNGDNYFGATQNKFRSYKIKKGTPMKLQNQFIEKRGSRIDTIGEKKGLKLAAYVKKSGWLNTTKKKRKVKKK